MLKWLAIHTQRAGWAPAELARATAGEGGALPEVEFIAEAQRCDVCDHPLAVLKSRRRRVVTLEAGTFVAKEVLKYCPGDGSHPVIGSSVLARLVKPYQRYGYDLVVYVGLARYLRGSALRSRPSCSRTVASSCPRRASRTCATAFWATSKRCIWPTPPPCVRRCTRAIRCISMRPARTVEVGYSCV